MSDSEHPDDREKPKEAAPASDSADGKEDAPKEGGADPQKDGGSKGFHPSKKAIIIAVLVLLVLTIVGLLYYLHARQFVSTDDAYTTGHIHQISSRVAGTVIEVKIADNQLVKRNDVLVRLDPREFVVALAETKAAFLQARAKAKQSDAKIAQAHAQLSAANAQVAQSSSRVTQAKAQLDRAQADYDRIAGLYSKDIKAVSKADVDQATQAFKNAEGQLEGARADLAATAAQAEASTADVQAAVADAEAAKANIVSSEAQVQNAELQLSYCNVLSPVDGKVSRKTVETGQRLQPGQALLAIVPDDVWVLANLKETQLTHVQIGQRVDVKIDSLDDKIFYGTVNSIQEGTGATFSLLPPDNATGNFTKIVQRVPVKIVFDEPSVRAFRAKIVPGLSVTPTIDLESLKNHDREPARQQRIERQNRDAEKAR